MKDTEAVLSVAHLVSPDGVCVGMCETAVQTAAVVRKELCLNGYSVEVADLATNKFKMIEQIGCIVMRLLSSRLRVCK